MINEYQDPYTYPGTNVLVNKFGIKDQDQLNTVERNLTANRLAELYNNPIQGNFDFEHLKKIHGYIFQDIYDWAGKERTVEISKHTNFCPVLNIPGYADSIFKELRKENYFRGLDQEEFSKKAAKFFSDLNELHPFREGNGRAQREFMRELALSAGYELDLNKVPNRRMLDASLQGHYGLFGGFENIIKAYSKPLEQNNQEIIFKHDM